MACILFDFITFFFFAIDIGDANSLSLHEMSINNNEIKSKSLDAIKNANSSITVSKKRHRHSGNFE